LSGNAPTEPEPGSSADDARSNGAATDRDGPSLLFPLTLVATVAAAAAGATADPNWAPGYALDSNVVYRFEVGLAVLAALYVVALAVWLAWYGKGFFKLAVGPASAEAPGAEHIEGAASDLEALREDFEEFRREAKEALSTLNKRL
jgi:hypothetical protein